MKTQALMLAVLMLAASTPVEAQTDEGKQDDELGEGRQILLCEEVASGSGAGSLYYGDGTNEESAAVGQWTDDHCASSPFVWIRGEWADGGTFYVQEDNGSLTCAMGGGDGYDITNVDHNGGYAFTELGSSSHPRTNVDFWCGDDDRDETQYFEGYLALDSGEALTMLPFPLPGDDDDDEDQA